MKCNVELMSRRMEELGLSNFGLSRLCNNNFEAVTRAANGENVLLKTAWAIAQALQLDFFDLTDCPKTLGSCLAYSRLSQGLTRMQLSKITGVPEHDLANWERGRNCPNIWGAYYVACALGMTINDCFGLDVDFAKKQGVAE